MSNTSRSNTSNNAGSTSPNRTQRLFAVLKKFSAIAINAIGLFVLFSITFGLILRLFVRPLGSFRGFLTGSLVAFALVSYAVFILYKLFWKQRHRNEAFIRDEIEASSLDSAAAKALVFRLRSRAVGLRWASWITLFLTFLAIAFGLYIFTTAGDIAQRDVLSQRLEQELYESKLRERSDLRDIESALRDFQSSDPTLVREIQELKTQLDASSRRTEDAVRNATQGSGGNAQLLFFLSTISTRLGSVLLLVFLVQILLSVYRYSIRLVSYYESRADALILFRGEDVSKLTELVSTLAAEKVEFGKAPPSPAEHATDLLRSIASLRK